jgi:nucleotide-binding universal stress UspA family protein
VIISNIIGSHGHNAVYDLLFGSIAESIVRRSTLPVPVMPSKS